MIDAVKTDRLAELTQQASRIAVVTHMKPDGDAMGSSLAMYRFLKEFVNGETRIVLNDRYPESLSFMVSTEEEGDILTYSEDIVAASDYIAGADLIICLDFNAFHRAENLEPLLLEADCKKVLIDHHLFPDTERFDLVFSTQEISSASELLFHILKAMPQCGGKAAALPLEAAEALMTGMTTDTNNFNNSVYPSTFNMASELIAMGVDRDRILFNLFTQTSDMYIYRSGIT